jgi:hypothetical protein
MMASSCASSARMLRMLAVRSMYSFVTSDVSTVSASTRMASPRMEFLIASKTSAGTRTRALALLALPPSSRCISDTYPPAPSASLRICSAATPGSATTAVIAALFTTSRSSRFFGSCSL